MREDRGHICYGLTGAYLSARLAFNPPHGRVILKDYRGALKYLMGGPFDGRYGCRQRLGGFAAALSASVLYLSLQVNI
jgi:hypothetical protein